MCKAHGKECEVPNSKLTSDLALANLAIRFDVNAHGIDNLTKAIEAGEIQGMLEACANSMYGGDMRPVLAQFNRNLSSQRCTRKIVDTASRNRADMVEALWAMTHSTAVKGAPKARSGFTYTKEEVDSLVASGDVEELQRFYNNIHSIVSKSISGLAMSQLDDQQKDRIAVKEYASEKLSALKASVKAASLNKAEVSEKLLGKLSGGKATSLSKAEVEELLKLLGK